jgi:hypothetical protein
LNKASVVWCGPSDYAADFASKFNRRVVVDASALFNDSRENVLDTYAALARTQKQYLSVGEIDAMQPLDLLRTIVPPGVYDRKHEWETMFKDTEELQTFVYDVGHHPSRGGAGGAYWPTQLRSTMVMKSTQNTDEWRIATGMEYFGALGYHLFDNCILDYSRTKLYSVLSELEFSQQRRLAGNGIHIAAVTSWLQYVLANTIRRPTVVPLHSLSDNWDVGYDSDPDD